MSQSSKQFHEEREITHEQDMKNFNYEKKLKEFYEQNPTMSIEEIAHIFVMRFCRKKTATIKELPF